MRVELVPVSKIKPAAYNPRKDLKPDDPEYKAIKLAIETHGFVDPLVWNEKTGNLVD
jgi:ParB-like chromosome segregation protein Spo0J